MDVRWPATSRIDEDAPQLRTLIGTLLATLAAAALCQVAKHIAFPHITISVSHAITIAMCGLVATFATYRALRKKARLVAAYQGAETDRIGLADAMEQASDSIVITDNQGRIEYINPAFTVLTGYDAAEAIGQSTRMLKSGLQSPRFYQDLWNTIGKGIRSRASTAGAAEDQRRKRTKERSKGRPGELRVARYAAANA